MKINEAYVVPDEMRKFVNYTTIQTGVNLAVTGVMWLGIGLMGHQRRGRADPQAPIKQK